MCWHHSTGEESRYHFSHRSRTDSDCRSCEHSVDCRLIPIFQTVTIVFRKPMAATASHRQKFAYWPQSSYGPHALPTGPNQAFLTASPPAHPDCGYCRPWQNAGSRYPDVGVDCTRQRQAHSGRHRKKHDDAVPKRNVESLYYSARAAGFQPNPKDPRQSALQLQSLLLLW